MQRNRTFVLTDPDEVTRAGPERVGGKAANLARLAGASRLAEAGARVPPWFVVTADAFGDALAAAGLEGWLAERLRGLPNASPAPGGLEALCTEIRERLLALELPPELREELAAHHERIAGAGELVAVRSSAAGEDASGDSFAGLHDSFLFVRGADGLAEAVRGVWASAYTERALAYRLRRGLPVFPVAMAAVVQRMVEAEASGVLFTADPNTGDVHSQVLSALWGAGEGLVSAGLEADTFVVDKVDGSIGERIADKEEELRFDRSAGRGLERVPVAEERRRRPSLAPDRVREVARAGLAAERHFGRPQDVELSYDADGRLWILQARPITTVEELGPAAGNRRIWDNSNIIESYSGVTSPLTFSFIRRAYSIVYHCFAEVMGIDRRTVHANRPTFENMLGLFRGQVYYNLLNWYQLVRLFPGYESNRKFMESMMGVAESLDDDAVAPVSRWRRWFVELPALVRLSGRIGWRFLRIERIVADFQAYFDARYQRWSAIDLRTLEPQDALALYREMEDELLWEWKAPIVNDFYVMVFYGTLRSLCSSWCGDDTGSLQNDLLCGQGGIESTAPTRRLLELAAEARRDPELAAALAATPPAELARTIPGDPRFAGFAAEIADYLERYGFRCMNELKLEEPSLRDRPEFLYQVLRNYVTMEEDAFAAALGGEERERRVRVEAEERAGAALRRSGGWTGRMLPRHWIFRRVLANARRGVRNRENLRFARTKIYGLLRELVTAVGERFAAEGLLDDGRDVFYLTLDEVWDFVRGTAVTTDLRGLVELRRREFTRYREETEAMPDDRFVTYGLPYHRNRFRARTRPGGEAASGKEGALAGIGCCPGMVKGTVKVVRSPEDDVRLAGEILVAGRTDPGWVPLYPSVSGLLIERGSILSHSAIVAREMGIPTVVSIPGLLERLETGDRVRMDGSAGTVEVLD